MDGSATDCKSSISTLSFGPTWLKQFSNPDGQRNLEPDGLTFQMAKHRYTRDEMLAIFSSIEQKFVSKSMPKELIDLEGFCLKELQKPILLFAPTTEEQKLMSSCVNSQAALNAFSKAKGTSGSSRCLDNKKSSKDVKAINNRGSTRGRDKDQKSKKNSKEWRSNKDWSGSKKSQDDSFKNRANDSKESQPEWFNEEETEIKELNESKTMTFDENGKFIIQDECDKELNEKIDANNESLSLSSKSICDSDEKELGDIASRMTDILINEADEKLEINELNQQFQQAQAQLMANRLQSGSVEDFSVGDKWFYLDSHSKIQGPFSSEQMANWLASGYFSMNLMVKRGCDDKFVPLGLIVQNLNQMRVQQPSSSFKTPPSQTNTQNLPKFFPKQNVESADSNLSNIVQQLQQIQIQQKTAVASLNTLGVNTVASILQELRNKQESLISKINITKQNSPIINNILQQSLNLNAGWNGQGLTPMSNPQLGASSNPLKDKILALMEIKRKEEEKRRLIEEEIRLKQEEEKKRLIEEARIKQLIIMSKLARQQNLNINQNLPNYLEQQALEKKMLMEQIKLKEMLNAQPASVNNAMGHLSGQQFSSFSNDQSFTDLLRKENEFKNEQGKQISAKFSDDIAKLSAKSGYFASKNDQIIES